MLLPVQGIAQLVSAALGPGHYHVLRVSAAPEPALAVPTGDDTVLAVLDGAAGIAPDRADPRAVGFHAHRPDRADVVYVGDGGGDVSPPAAKFTADGVVLAFSPDEVMLPGASRSRDGLPDPRSDYATRRIAPLERPPA